MSQFKKLIESGDHTPDDIVGYVLTGDPVNEQEGKQPNPNRELLDKIIDKALSFEKPADAQEFLKNLSAKAVKLYKLRLKQDEELGDEFAEEVDGEEEEGGEDDDTEEGALDEEEEGDDEEGMESEEGEDDEEEGATDEEMGEDDEELEDEEYEYEDEKEDISEGCKKKGKKR
jgi:hypothetical protein